MRVFKNKNIKNIFVNYLEFHNVKQEMNFRKGQLSESSEKKTSF